MTDRGAPSGEGPRRFGDAIVNQNEADALRRGITPRSDGGVISVIPPYSFASINAFTANRLVLFGLPLVERDSVVEEVRCRVAAGDPGSAKVALYAFRNSERTFYQIAGSKTSFDTASAGVRISTLQTPPRLVAHGFYFLAFLPSSAVPTFATSGSGAGVVAQLYRDGVSELPTSLPLAQFSRTSTAIYVPGVVYLSRLWKDIL